jgi:catechol 2,3-dioxygenase-like lactoylglutathione lyase family enzyme
MIVFVFNPYFHAVEKLLMNLNQVTITSRDLSVSIEFYQLLGLQLIVDAQPRYARMLCPEGNSTLSLHHHALLVQNEGITLYFEVASLDQTVNDLRSKGVKFETLPVDQTWLWREASLVDPDGHKIILYYAGENRMNPPWRIPG